MDKARFFVFDTFEDYKYETGRYRSLYNFVCLNSDGVLLKGLVIRHNVEAIREFLKGKNNDLLTLEYGGAFVKEMGYFINASKIATINSWLIDGMSGRGKRIAYDVLVENLLPPDCKET